VQTGQLINSHSLALIVSNSILDAAHHSGTLLPGFLQAYGVYALPALPVVCMVGWALIWSLDPSSREHDMIASVRTATHEALMAQIQKAAESVDISQAVENAAGEAARALVSETLGNAPRRAPNPPLMTAQHSYNAEAEPAPMLERIPAKTSRAQRGRSPETEATPDPK
jgi:hypothetical protein